MALALRSLHDIPNADSTIDRRYPLGNKPISGPSSLSINLAAFNAANLNLSRLPLGTPVDINYRQYLQGTSATTAAIAVSSALGSLGNWVVDPSGNGISNVVNAAASGTLFVTANDGAGTVVSFPNQPWSILPASQQGATKLPLGHYAWFDNPYFSTKDKAEQTAFNAAINGLLADPTIKGVEIAMTWAQLEGNQGDYSNGFATIDAILAKLRTANRPFYLIIKFWHAQFYSSKQTPSSTDGNAWPAYVISNNWVKAFTSSSNVVRNQLDYDQDAVWAALTARDQAYGDRYDKEPLIAMWGTSDESDAVSVKNTGTQTLPVFVTILNSLHYQAKYQQFHLDVKAHWPTTLVWATLNFLPPGGTQEVTAMCTLITTLRQAYPGGFAFGGPDPAIQGVHGGGATNWITTFQNIVTGQAGTLGNITGQVVLVNHIEEYLLGNLTDSTGKKIKPPVTPTQIMNSALNLYKAQIGVWNDQNWEFYVWADELAAIHAVNGLTNPAPSEGNFVVL